MEMTISKTDLKKKVLEVLGKIKEIPKEEMDLTLQNTDNKNYLLIAKKNLTQFIFELVETEMFYKDAGLNTTFNTLVYLRLLKDDEFFNQHFDLYLNQTINETELDLSEVIPGTLLSASLLLDTNINSLLLGMEEENKEGIEAAFVAAFVMAITTIMFNERIELEETKDVSEGFLKDEPRK